jgi:hypothetical protein
MLLKKFSNCAIHENDKNSFFTIEIMLNGLFWNQSPISFTGTTSSNFIRKCIVENNQVSVKIGLRETDILLFTLKLKCTKIILRNKCSITRYKKAWDVAQC